MFIIALISALYCVHNKLKIIESVATVITGIPEKCDPEPWEDPGLYENPGLSEDSKP